MQPRLYLDRDPARGGQAATSPPPPHQQPLRFRLGDRRSVARSSLLQDCQLGARPAGAESAGVRRVLTGRGSRPGPTTSLPPARPVRATLSREAPLKLALGLQVMQLAVCAAAGPGANPTDVHATATPQRSQLIVPNTGRRSMLKAGLAAGLCACCPPPLAALAEEAAAPAAAAPAVAAPAAPAWGYSCLTGPEYWSGTCATVGFQSPIALSFDASHPPPGDGLLQPLLPKFPRYIKEGVTVKNTGHGTMMVSCCRRWSRGGKAAGQHDAAGRVALRSAARAAAGQWRRERVWRCCTMPAKASAGAVLRHLAAPLSCHAAGNCTPALHSLLFCADQHPPTRPWSTPVLLPSPRITPHTPALPSRNPPDARTTRRSGLPASLSHPSCCIPTCTCPSLPLQRSAGVVLAAANRKPSPLPPG